MAERYIRLLWYQWLIPAPMITQHLPPVVSAVFAHSRAKPRTVFLSMPVHFSCQAGV
jgi:hypothetical protein